MRRGERKTSRTELPRATRMMIVVMRHHRKASFQDIADHLDLKVNTVKTIWQRCVARVGNSTDLVALCENVGTLPRSGRPKNSERAAREVGSEEMDVVDEDVEVEIEVGRGGGGEVRGENRDGSGGDSERGSSESARGETQAATGEGTQTERQTGTSTILVRTKASILEQLRRSGGNPIPPQVLQPPLLPPPIPRPHHIQLQLVPPPLPAPRPSPVQQGPILPRAIQPRPSPPQSVPPLKTAIPRAYFPFQPVQPVEQQMSRPPPVVEQLQEAASATAST